MIRNLSRVIMRQLPHMFSYPCEGFIRSNAMQISGVFISSSCVHRKRYNYGVPKDEHSKTRQDLYEMVSDDDGGTDTLVPVGREYRDRVKDEEIYSDESESDESDSETALENLNINFVTLRRGSAAARKELQQCMSEVATELKTLVKTTTRVKFLTDMGIMPEKIFFTILNDLLYLKVPLEGIELYKIHPKDAPDEMKWKKRTPFFAVFNPERKTYTESTDEMPLTLICEGSLLYKHVTKIVATALTCGCKSILFTSDCGFTGLSSVFRVLADGDGTSPTLTNQSWDVIRRRLKSDANVFFTSVAGRSGKWPTEKNKIRTVDFNDMDVWSTDEAILVCMNQPSPEAVDFLVERKGREIVIPGEVPAFSKNLMNIAAITFEFRKQWQDKGKTKTLKVK